jgi:hypothetical protein
MDNQNMPPQESSSPMPSMGQPAPENKSVGALIGSIIVVIILIIGGFYLWNTKVSPVADPSMMEKGMPIMNGTAEEMTVEEQALNQPDLVLSQMAAVAASDETVAIDTDLKATNLDGMDSDFQTQ